MLQAVIYYIVTVILTKELVIATDQCTEYQFKSPGVSCEVIYNKNPESHQCSGYYWTVKRAFCGMTYSGSSCEHIYNKYPEIKVNPKEKSGYYRLNSKQWTYCNMTKIAANDDDFTPSCAAVEVMKCTYQSFLLSESCESIYNNNAESHEWFGYYWITSGRVYCGMDYTGSSCEDIYYNNPETGDKSGYFHVNLTANGHIVICQQFLTVTSSPHVLVWEEDGEELLILTSVQETIVRVNGGRPHNLVLASVEWSVTMINSHVLLPISLLMELATRGCVGEGVWEQVCSNSNIGKYQQV